MTTNTTTVEFAKVAHRIAGVAVTLLVAASGIDTTGMDARLVAKAMYYMAKCKTNVASNVAARWVRALHGRLFQNSDPTPREFIGRADEINRFAHEVINAAFSPTPSAHSVIRLYRAARGMLIAPCDKLDRAFGLALLVIAEQQLAARGGEVTQDEIVARSYAFTGDAGRTLREVNQLVEACDTAEIICGAATEDERLRQLGELAVTTRRYAF